MAQFKCFFLDHALDTEPDLRFYAEFFLNYQPSLWQNGGGDGVFSFISDAGDKADLSVLENTHLGISVRYNFRAAGERKGVEFYAMGHPAKMHLIEDCGDDQFVPAGSFLPPEKAWLAVEDFFTQPLDKSRRVEWVSSAGLATNDC